jgi:hypothetical protein
MEYVYYALFHGVDINKFSLHDSLNFTFVLVYNNFMIINYVVSYLEYNKSFNLELQNALRQWPMFS